MTDAPERIWANPYGDYWEQKPHYDGLVSYIREDVHLTAVEQAKQKERERIKNILSEEFPVLRSDVLAATKYAVQAAVEQAREDALEEAMKAVDEAGYYCLPECDETGDLSEQLDHSLAAIRALKGKDNDRT